MIYSLVQSAFQTGCLSVASEGLIHQVMAMKGYKPADLEALDALDEAVKKGIIQREARGSVLMLQLGGLPRKRLLDASLAS